MSFQRMVTATCDSDTGIDCAISSDTSGWTIAEAWSYAKNNGWHRNGNRTICPSCWERGER